MSFYTFTVMLATVTVSYCWCVNVMLCVAIIDAHLCWVHSSKWLQTALSATKVTQTGLVLPIIFNNIIVCMLCDSDVSWLHTWKVTVYTDKPSTAIYSSLHHRWLNVDISTTSWSIHGQKKQTLPLCQCIYYSRYVFLEPTQ